MFDGSLARRVRVTYLLGEESVTRECLLRSAEGGILRFDINSEEFSLPLHEVISLEHLD